MAGASYVPIAHLKGPVGDRGPKGDTGTIAAVSAETVPASSPAEVILSGTEAQRTAHFKIPQGLPGTNGVESDAAVSTYVLAAASQTRAALAATYATLGIFENFDPVNFRRFQARLAQAEAGRGRAATIAQIGDSNSSGFQQPDGSDYRRSAGARAMQALDGKIRSVWGPIFSRIGHTGAFARVDQRFTLGSGWAALNSIEYGPAGAGAVRGTGPTGGALQFTPDTDSDDYTVWLEQSAASASSVTVSLPDSRVVVLRDSFTRRVPVVKNQRVLPETGTTEYLVSNVTAGLWSIDGGKLYSQVVTAAAAGMILVADAGSADGRYTVRRGTDIFDRIIFRYVDASNFLMIANSGAGKYRIAKVVDGVTSTLAETPTLTWAPDDLITVELAGSSIKLFVNDPTEAGAAALAATETAFATSTIMGVGNGNQTVGSKSRFGDMLFSVSSLTINLNGADAVRVVRFGASSASRRAVQISVASTGYATVLAARGGRAGATGVEWAVSGYNSGTATLWNAAKASPWGTQGLMWSTLRPALTIINLMINHHTANQAIASYKAEISTLVATVQAAGSDVILVASGAGGTGSVSSWVNYLNALREVAAEKGCGLVNIQERWPAYATASADPYQLWNDADHPSDAGYWDMGRAYSDAVLLAAGRAG